MNRLPVGISRRRRARLARRHRLSIEHLERRELLAALTVTNTADDGAGSLRQALLTAGNTSTVDTVRFNIPPTDPGHVYYQDDRVDGQVSRDRIRSTFAPDDAAITDIDPDWPHSWYSIGIDNKLIVQGSLLLVDGYSQAGAVPNSDPDGFNGVLRVEVNSRADAGLIVTAANSQIRGLAINGVGGYGVRIYSTAPSTVTGATVSGNFLGTDVSGTIAMGHSHGVWATSSGNLVGGTNPADRNIVSGNSDVGIWLGSHSDSNVVQGNFVGVARDGTTPLGNVNAGIHINTFTEHHVIGGPQPGAGNLIAHNIGRGINGGAASTNNILVQGNVIHSNTTDGVLASAPDTQVIGNHIHSNQGHGIVGGSAATNQRYEANTINDNGMHGIHFNGDGGAFTANLISGNGSLGINLLGGTEDEFGVTANDDGDADTGPNELQNFPVLESILTPEQGIVINGSINGEPSTTYQIEFFSSSQVDASGHGEGENYLGLWAGRTDGNGDVEFQADLSIIVPGGHFVTATASRVGRKNGKLLLSHTSEFSAALEAAVQPGSILGQVFIDGDASGTREVGEGGFDGITIELVDPSTSEVLATQITASVDVDGDGTIQPATESGLYQFADLAPGTYFVRQQILAGYRQTLPTPGEPPQSWLHTVVLQQGELESNVDFGNQLIPVGTAQWDGGGDGVSWHDLLNWRDDVLPGRYDDVVIDGFNGVRVLHPVGETSIQSLKSDATLVVSGGTFQIDDPSNVGGLELAGDGSLVASGDLDVRGTMLLTDNAVLTGDGDVDVRQELTWQRGTMAGAGTTTAMAGLRITGPDPKFIQDQRTLVNEGDAVWDEGDVARDDHPVFINSAGATFEIKTDGDFFGAYVIGGRIENWGTIVKSVTLGTTSIASFVENHGDVEVRSGTLRFRQGYEQRLGRTFLNGGNLESNELMRLTGGQLDGSGRISGDVFSDALISPGEFPLRAGRIEVTGDLTSSGKLRFEILGFAPGVDFDRIDVGGLAVIGGTVQTFLADLVDPVPGHPFEVMTYGAGAIGATFGDGEFIVNVGPTAVTLTKSAAIESTEAIRDLNAGLQALLEWLRGLAGMFDLPDFDFAAKGLPQIQIPVLPDRFEDLFSVQTTLDALLTPVFDTAATYGELAAQLAGTELTIQCVAGGLPGIDSCSGGDAIRVVLHHTEDLSPTGPVPFNDGTPDALPVLSPGLDLDGQLAPNGELEVLYVVGVDQNGFFVEDESRLTLHVSTEESNVSGTGRIAGVPNRTSEGSSGAELDVSIVTAQGKPQLRLADLAPGQPTPVLPTVTGTAYLMMDTDLSLDDPQAPVVSSSAVATFTLSVGADQATSLDVVRRETYRLPGGVRVSGELIHELVDVDTNPDPQITQPATVPYGVVRGELEVAGVRSDVELAITEFGPISGSIHSPLGISLSDSGWTLSGVSGELQFVEEFRQSLPTNISDPLQLFPNELDVPVDHDLNDEEVIRTFAEPVVQAATTALAIGEVITTWGQPFTMVLDGVIGHTSASIWGTATLAVDVGDFIVDAGLQWIGIGDLNVFGLPLAPLADQLRGQTRMIFDTSKSIATSIEAAVRAPLQGNPLSFLFPAHSDLIATLEGAGLSQLSVLAIREMLQQLRDDTLGEGGPLLTAALGRVAENLPERNPDLAIILRADPDSTEPLTPGEIVDALLQRIPTTFEQLDDTALVLAAPFAAAFQSEMLTAMGEELLYQLRLERFDGSESATQVEEILSDIRQRLGLQRHDATLPGFPDPFLAALGSEHAWSSPSSIMVHPKSDGTADVSDGQQFSVSDGQTDVTFEFDLVELGNGVAEGAVAIPISVASSVRSAVAEIARRIRQSALELSAEVRRDGVIALRTTKAFQDVLVDRLDSAISSLGRQTSVHPQLARDALVAWQSVFRQGVQSAVVAIGGVSSPIDPQLTIRGEFSPLFAGVPLGRPGYEAQVTFSQQGLSFEADFNPTGTFDALANATDSELVRSLSELFAVPDSRGGLIKVNLPHGDTPELRVDAILTLLDGEQPVALDPLGDGWQLEFPGAIDVFGFPIEDLIGVATGTAKDLLEQGLGFTQQARDAISQTGGILLSGGYQLPAFIRDPFAAIASLPAQLPQDLVPLLDQLMESFGQLEEVATVELFVPSLASLLESNLLEHTVETANTVLQIAKVVSAANRTIMAPLINTIDSIVLAAGHVFQNGDAVVLVSDDPPLGLRSGQTYFISKRTSDSFALASSRTNALAGRIIELGSAGSGEHFIERASRIVSQQHGYAQGDAIRLGSGVAPEPLQSDTTYFVTNVLADSFSLARSAADAVVGLPIELLGSVTGTFELLPVAIDRVARFGFAAAATHEELSQPLTALLDAAYFEGTWQGPLLGIQFGEARLRGSSEGLTVTGDIPWMGNLEPEFQVLRFPAVVQTPAPLLGPDGRPIPFTIPVPYPSISAELGAADGFSDEILVGILESWGLNDNIFSVAGDTLPKFRAYSPLSSLTSVDPLQQRGGIELAADLALPGIAERGHFTFELTPPEASLLVPGFSVSASGDDFLLAGFADTDTDLIDFQDFGVTISNRNGPLEGEIGGVIQLFGSEGLTLKVNGDLSVGADGVSGEVPLIVLDDQGELFGFSGMENFKLLIDPAASEGMVIQMEGDLELPGGFVIEKGVFELSAGISGLRVRVDGGLSILGQQLWVEENRELEIATTGIFGALELSLPSGDEFFELPSSLGPSWSVDAGGGGHFGLSVTPASSELTIAGSLSLPTLASSIEVSGALGAHGFGRLTGAVEGVPILTADGAFRISGDFELLRLDDNAVPRIKATVDGEQIEWADVIIDLNGAFPVSVDGSFEVSIPQQTLDLHQPTGPGMELAIPPSTLTVGVSQFELALGGSELSIPGFPALSIPPFTVTDWQTGRFQKSLSENTFLPSAVDVGIFRFVGDVIFGFDDAYYLQVTQKTVGVNENGKPIVAAPRLDIPGLFSEEISNEVTIAADGTFALDVAQGSIGTDDLSIDGGTLLVGKDGPGLDDFVMSATGASLELPLIGSLSLPPLTIRGDGVIESVGKLGQTLATVSLPVFAFGEQLGLNVKPVVEMYVQPVADILALTVEFVQHVPLALFGQSSGDETLELAEAIFDSAGRFAGTVSGQVPVAGVVLGTVTKALSFTLEATPSTVQLVMAGPQAAKVGFVDVVLSDRSFIESDGDYRFLGSASVPYRLGDASFLEFAANPLEVFISSIDGVAAAGVLATNAGIALPFVNEPIGLGDVTFGLDGSLQNFVFELAKGLPLWETFTAFDPIAFGLRIGKVDNQDIVTIEAAQPANILVRPGQTLPLSDLVMDSTGRFSAVASGGLTLSYPILIGGGNVVGNADYQLLDAEFQAIRDGDHVQLEVSSGEIDLGFFNGAFTGRLRSDGANALTASNEEVDFDLNTGIEIKGEGAAVLATTVNSVGIGDVDMSVLGFPMELSSLTVRRISDVTSVVIPSSNKKKVDLGFLKVRVSGRAHSDGSFSFHGSKSLHFDDGVSLPGGGNANEIDGTATFSLSDDDRFEGSFDGHATIANIRYTDASGTISKGGCLAISKPVSARFALPGGQCSRPSVKLFASDGYVSGGTAFFDANGNGRRDFVDTNDNGIQDEGELREPATTTGADGSAAFFIPSEFDRNGDGQFSLDEGRIIVIGGIDVSTLLPSTMPMWAPVDLENTVAVTPLTTLIASVAIAQGVSVSEAAETIRGQWSLPAVDLLQYDAIAELQVGDQDARPVLAATAKLQDSAVQISRLIAASSDDISLVDAAGAVYTAVASAVAGLPDTVDFADASWVTGLVEQIAMIVGVNLDDSLITSAAEVVAAANASINVISDGNDLAFLSHLARVQRVAQGQAASDLALAAAGILPPAQLTRRYTGAELANRVAIAPIGNVIPPRIEIRDAVVQSSGNGEMLVDVAVRLAHPVASTTSVEYRSGDGSARADEGDYGAVSGLLTFEPGQTEKKISITVAGGGPRGDFFVYLYAAEGAVLATSRGRVEIFPSWQNPTEPLDVNGDGRVTALDALRVINHLGVYGPGPLADLPSDPDSPSWVDTTGDGSATGLDALRVINFLAMRSASEGEGEITADVLGNTSRQATFSPYMQHEAHRMLFACDDDWWIKLGPERDEILTFD
jgi:hypothetical protein